MKTKIKFVIFSILAILLFATIAYFYPKNFTKEYNAIRYKPGDSSYSEKIKVSIDGYLSHGFFSGNTFKGTITIGDTKLSSVNLKFDSYDKAVIDILDESTGHSDSYGDIFSDNIKKQFSIRVFQPSGPNGGGKSWDSQDGIFISAPANNRAEAEEISSETLWNYIGKKY